LTISSNTPCIIGVGRHTWHPDEVGPDGAPEPLDMWEHVARAAGRDTGAANVLERLDAIEIVYCQTWQYDDAVQRLAERIGAAPRRRNYSGIGGTMGQQLVAATAERMLAGELDLALITSAEALATQRAYKKRGERARYSFKPGDRRPFPWEAPPDPVEVAHEVFQAWLTFAIFENARRGHLGTPLDTYRHEVASMLSRLTRVAAANPHAWFPIERSAADIADVRADNRMVGYPYTKYMVSVMDVDMAAALILATHGTADALGVPSERRVYPRGWSYATDPVLVAARPEMWRSPAMRAAARTALVHAGVDLGDIAAFDLYSCFGSSLNFSCDALGLAPDDPRGLTVTGGLPYHGGPGSGYLVHAIATMTDTLRAAPGSYGLVSGVGMHMTKHAFGVYSTTPGPVAASDAGAVQQALDAAGAGTVPVVAEHDGDARVVGYSVVHDRAGAPESAVLVCETPAGTRTYARAGDPEACRAAESEELVGRTVTLVPRTVTGAFGETRANVATW
jgi:acetyl-CoA C-acetyltransferase